MRENADLKGASSLGRVGEADEMANLIAFVVSDGNSYMTGANIVADGGVI